MTQTDEPKPGETPTPAEPQDASVDEAAATTPESPETTLDGKGAPWALLVGLVLLVGAVIAGVVTWPQWRDQVMPSRGAPVAAGDQDLRAELADTRERLRRLEAALAARAGADGGAADLAPVQGRLDALDSAVQTLQRQPQVPAKLVDDVGALQAQVAELRKTAADASAVLRIADRLDKVEAELRDIQAQRSSAAALLLAVGQLREAVNNAMPFDTELRAVRALAPQDAAAQLDALKPHAAAGIPTRLVLAGRFESLAPELVRASVLPEKQGWWRDTLRQLAGLINIRREDGETAGTGVPAAVARAEAHLKRGNLAGAVAELEPLSGAAAEAVAPWLADARARLEAEAALSALTADVVAQLGAATAATR